VERIERMEPGDLDRRRIPSSKPARRTLPAALCIAGGRSNDDADDGD
jgi:hypothetical protein